MTTTELQHVARRDVAKPRAGIAIEVRALTKTYPGGVVAVKSIAFTATTPPGYVLVSARTSIAMPARGFATSRLATCCSSVVVIDASVHVSPRHIRVGSFVTAMTDLEGRM